MLLLGCVTCFDIAMFEYIRFCFAFILLVCYSLGFFWWGGGGGLLFIVLLL